MLVAEENWPPYLGDDAIHLDDLVDEAAEELARGDVVGAKLADERNVHLLPRATHLAQGGVVADVVDHGILKRGDGFGRIVNQSSIQVGIVILWSVVDG